MNAWVSIHIIESIYVVDSADEFDVVESADGHAILSSIEILWR